MCNYFYFYFSKFNHPNIVKVLGVCVDNDPVYIIMELMPAGDLLKFLRDAKRDHVGFLLMIILWCFVDITWLYYLLSGTNVAYIIRAGPDSSRCCSRLSVSRTAALYS